MSISKATFAIKSNQIRNVPASGQGAQILAQLAKILQRLHNMSQRLDGLELQLEASDCNTLARIEYAFQAI
ncbi:hypothetical protein DFP73DRAFT_596051 [Morchella snyderi]|nr:hypothetical protein DFP73DRAFT_596051 [Morchella snyderi]